MILYLLLLIFIFNYRIINIYYFNLLSSLTFKLNYQYITLLIFIFYRNISFLNVFLLKILKKTFFVILKKNTIISLVWNKIFQLHVSFYIICLYRLIFLSNNTKFLNLLIFTTLFLGSLWSFQEIMWGAFWNWNLIEVTILIFFISIFFLSHVKKNYYWINKYILLLIGTYLYFNHLPLKLSIHNFVNNKLIKTYFIFIVSVFFIFNCVFVYKILVVLWCTPIIYLFINVNSLILTKIVILTFLLFIFNFKFFILNLVLSFNFIISLLVLFFYYVFKLKHVKNISHYYLIVSVYFIIIIQYYYTVFLIQKYNVLYFNKNEIILYKNQNLFNKNKIKSKLNIFYTNTNLILYIYVK